MYSISQMHSEKGGLGVEEFEGHGTYVEEEDYIPSAKFETFRNLQEGDTFALGGVTFRRMPARDTRLAA